MRDLAANNDLLKMIENNDTSFEKMFVAKSSEQPMLRKVDVFDGNQSFINLGELGNYPFDMDDPIFELSSCCRRAAKYRGTRMKDINIKIKSCPICQKSLQFPKNVALCEFCGNFGCADCIYKKFPFPHKESKSAERESGDICMVCEWKMFLHQATSEIVSNIQKREDQLSTLESEIEVGQDRRTVELEQLTTIEDRLTEVKQAEEEKKERQENKVEN